MSKKSKTLLGILALFLLIVGLFYFVEPIAKKNYIEKQIVNAKYCKVDADCVDAGSKCPFGCYAYVNKNEVKRISDLIASYDSKCVYGCLACPTAVCEQGVCQESCKD